MQSKFSLLSEKYLFHDNKVAATISDSRYARPMLYRMEQLEIEEGTNNALQILFYLATQHELSSKVRIPSPVDLEAAKSTTTGPPTRYGHKHTCTRCTQKFFDLNGKIDKCPSCKSSIK